MTLYNSEQEEAIFTVNGKAYGPVRLSIADYRTVSKAMDAIRDHAKAQAIKNVLGRIRQELETIESWPV